MAAPSSLAFSHLADLHRAGGASPSPLPRRIRSSSASGALAAARSASSPWPNPASVGAGLLGHGDGGEAVNGVIVRADQPRLAAGGGVAGEEGYHMILYKYHMIRDRNRLIPYRYLIPHKYHNMHQVIAYEIYDDTYHVSCDSYHVERDTCEVLGIARFLRRIGVILARYHMIPTRYRSWASRRRGIVADGRVLPRPCSTLNPNLITGSRILPRPRSTSELVAGDRVLRRDLVTGGHVHRPRLSRWLRPPRRSSSPVPPLSLRRILRRPRPTPELVAGAVSVTTRRILRRPCDHAPRRNSPAAASSMPELGDGGGCVRAADVSLICAAPMVAFVLASEEGGQGAIPLGQYPNGIPVYSSSPTESIDSGEDG
uniref:OSJNBa0060P14.5 protein n=1 Tax=Oryza sativa subsp. japonica TaxID=39947 RepID=Q7XMZ5_ORYSJ|nr:OSJNBa0060P14.5 [Oryza sativa Japonica Group]